MSVTDKKPAALQVQSLSKWYGPLKAVDGVSFEVREGEIFGLLGPNGAGKTSIISTIVTLENPTAGNISVFGHDVQKDPKSAKMKLGWVPQEVMNHGFFNVDEILDFYAGYYGKKLGSAEKTSILSRLDLLPHRHKKVKQLSGGMKRRLMIAKALSHKPRLLLLDEPTAGVDIELRVKLWEFVKELRAEGVGILLTTHYLEEAEELCDRVGFISKGKIIKEGQTRDIVRDLTQKTVYLEMSEDPGPINHPFVHSQNGQTFVLKSPMNVPVFQAVQEAGLKPQQILDIRVTEGDLEDAFRKIMESPL